MASRKLVIEALTQCFEAYANTASVKVGIYLPCKAKSAHSSFFADAVPVNTSAVARSECALLCLLVAMLSLAQECCSISFECSSSRASV